MLSIETRSVHAGREAFSELGVHAPPIDLSTTYPLNDLAEATSSLDALAEGRRQADNPIYARLHNPTVARFERAFASLEQAGDAVAFGSGMAALTACLLAARSRGRHVVGIRPAYGGTDHLLSSGLVDVETTWVRPDAVRAALRPETALVVLETPANPTLELVSIADIVAQAGEVPVLVDSTFATPVLQRPLLHGATLVLHSATKFIGGHGDVLAGVVATGERWATELRKVRLATGGILHPLGAYLLHRGLPTLPLRVKRAQRTARLLAGRLARHRFVRRVAYPGLEACDPNGLVGTQMEGPGSMITFEVDGGYDVAATVLKEVRLITPAVSLGSVDTLIEHPAGLTHRIVPETVLRDQGISPGLLRLSIGLESASDLWLDLSTALRRAVRLCGTAARIAT